MKWFKLLVPSSSLRSQIDDVIWQFSSSGKYSVQSLYVVVNNMGVKQVYTPVMWKIPVPPRLHIFL
jgi:hypothetical protein